LFPAFVPAASTGLRPRASGLPLLRCAVAPADGLPPWPLRLAQLWEEFLSLAIDPPDGRLVRAPLPLLLPWCRVAVARLPALRASVPGRLAARLAEAPCAGLRSRACAGGRLKWCAAGLPFATGLCGAGARRSR